MKRCRRCTVNIAQRWPVCVQTPPSKARLYTSVHQGRLDEVPASKDIAFAFIVQRSSATGVRIAAHASTSAFQVNVLRIRVKLVVEVMCLNIIKPVFRDIQDEARNIGVPVEDTREVPAIRPPGHEPANGGAKYHIDEMMSVILSPGACHISGQERRHERGQEPPRTHVVARATQELA